MSLYASYISEYRYSSVVTAFLQWYGTILDLGMVVIDRFYHSVNGTSCYSHLGINDWFFIDKMNEICFVFLIIPGVFELIIIIIIWIQIFLLFRRESTPVGCIYASKPFNSSLIYYQSLFHSNSIIKHQKQLKYNLSIFVVFLLTLFSCHLYFLRYMSYKGSCHLLPSRPFDSWLRKHLLTHRLYLTIWLPDGQGAKVPGK